jgi:putative Holliday junction resolvase
MKILAIDFGEKRIGFSIGDSSMKMAIPLTPLNRKNSQHDLEHIKKILEEYEVDKIILGYPLNMNGTPGPITRKVEAFNNFLRKNLNIDIEFIDERLTSFEAEELLKPIIRDHKKRKAIIDSAAALVMLKNYLDPT